MNLITKAQLDDWLDSLAQKKLLIAPRDTSGVLLYRPVSNCNEIAWDYTLPVMSIKETFFPPTERLLAIEKHGQEVKLTETLPEEDHIVVFGVRPCDGRGIQILDELFLNNPPVDIYYEQRRLNTTLIGLACKEMQDTCFCTSMGSAPDDSSGMDIMMTEIEGSYALQVNTPKGEALLEGITLSGFYDEIPMIQRNESMALPQVWVEHFNDRYWERLSERCLSCRICAYVCPTCRCFAVRDEALDTSGEFERIRCWDSCTGENYRRIAGGHKPRAQKEERIRNRIFCKFYYYPHQYKMGEASACTGCGRCIKACPVNIDITEVLMEVAK